VWNQETVGVHCKWPPRATKMVSEIAVEISLQGRSVGCKHVGEMCGCLSQTLSLSHTHTHTKFFSYFNNWVWKCLIYPASSKLCSSRWVIFGGGGVFSIWTKNAHAPVAATGKPWNGASIGCPTNPMQVARKICFVPFILVFSHMCSTYNKVLWLYRCRRHIGGFTHS
jgi:hypothetical protein